MEKGYGMDWLSQWFKIVLPLLWMYQSYIYFEDGQSSERQTEVSETL